MSPEREDFLNPAYALFANLPTVPVIAITRILAFRPCQVITRIDFSRPQLRIPSPLLHHQAGRKLRLLNAVHSEDPGKAGVG
jgi:hypothetical protein